jgi:hypothetical protein
VGDLVRGVEALVQERDALALDKSVMLGQLRERTAETSAALRAQLDTAARHLARAAKVVEAARALVAAEESGADIEDATEAYLSMRDALAKYEEG